MVVVLENQTFVFSFMDLKLIESIETGANPYGICGLASNEKALSKTLVVPSQEKGQCRILIYGKSSN